VAWRHQRGVLVVGTKSITGVREAAGAEEDVTVFNVMDEDCGVRKAYMLLLGRKNPHSSLTIA
jgi:hypothetical protein